MAILQQGAALPEQILRRFFHWLQQVYGQFHMLNMKFLPEKKRYLIAGKDPDTDQAYGELSPQQLQLPVNFEFGATLLNTNKGVMSQSLTEIGQAIFNPLAMQFGVTGAEQFYQWAKDKVNSAQLDHMRYLKRPQGMPDTPPYTANDVIVILTEGHMPVGTNFVEGPIEAWQTLQKWVMSDELGKVHPENMSLVRGYLQQVQAVALQAQQQQAAMQASQQFQDMMGNKGQGQTGGSGVAPDMQTQSPTQDEIAGGSQHE